MLTSQQHDTECKTPLHSWSHTIIASARTTAMRIVVIGAGLRHTPSTVQPLRDNSMNSFLVLTHRRLNNITVLGHICKKHGPFSTTMIYDPHEKSPALSWNKAWGNWCIFVTNMLRSPAAFRAFSNAKLLVFQLVLSHGKALNTLRKMALSGFDVLMNRPRARFEPRRFLLHRTILRLQSCLTRDLCTYRCRLGVRCSTTAHDSSALQPMLIFSRAHPAIETATVYSVTPTCSSTKALEVSAKPLFVISFSFCKAKMKTRLAFASTATVRLQTHKYLYSSVEVLTKTDTTVYVNVTRDIGKSPNLRQCLIEI